MILHQFNMEDCIRDLLKRWGLAKYTDIFLKNGYDDVDIIRAINEGDLQAMGITCLTETCYILDTLSQLNQMFMTYMSVDEVYVRPSSEHVLSYVAEKLEREGVLPSGEDIVTVVLDKLEIEGIMMSPYNHQMYMTKDGYESSRREYNMLRARYAQELFLPNTSVTEALKLIHETSAHGLPPPKPPKPKVMPVYDSKSGKLVWVNNQEQSNYENINYLYEIINQISPSGAPTLPSRNGVASEGNIQHNHIIAAQAGELRKYEEVLKFESTQSANSSPIPVRPVKKKQTFFKRVKHNLFGKSNSSLDSYLASSTKTLISDRSSECSNSKLSFFNKNKSKKEKGRFERQRSNSAPEAARNVNLQLIPEVHNNVPFTSSHPNPTYARPYHQHSTCSSNSRERCRCGPNDIYAHVFPTRDQIEATPLIPHTPLIHHTPVATPLIPHHTPVQPTKSDTFSNTSISSGSVSGDSAYSSKPCLNAIRSSHRPVVYGPIPFTGPSGQFSVPLPLARSNSLEQRRRCPCCTCNHDNM